MFVIFACSFFANMIIFANIMKQEIINNAIEALKIQTGFLIKYKVNQNKTNLFDAYITLNFNNQTYNWVLETKNEITANYLIRLQDLAKNNIINNILLIADYINPKARELAQKLEINYLDTKGNIYLKQKNLIIKMDGNLKPIEPEKNKNRAFTNTGLKVLFYFLVDPANVNKTIREIANDTATALDTVHKTIMALIQMKFILKINANEYQLIQQKDLLDRWIRDFDIKLKDKLIMGTFRFARKDDELKWKMMKFTNTDTFWGGENAAAILTNYLNPGIFTLYTTCTKNELVQKYNLLPDTKGNVKVYKKFWNFTNQGNDLVPNLLTYADLIITGDDRCIETAKIIYNDLLANKYQ